MSAFTLSIKGLTRHCEAWAEAPNANEKDMALAECISYLYERAPEERAAPGSSPAEGAMIAAVLAAEQLHWLYPHDPRLSGTDAQDYNDARNSALRDHLTALTRLGEITGQPLTAPVVAYLSRPFDPIEPVETSEPVVEVGAELDSAILDADTGGDVLARLIDAVQHDAAPTPEEFERIRWTWGNVYRRILDAREALNDAETEATKGGAA